MLSLEDNKSYVQLISKLFKSKEIIKLGCAFRDDLKAMHGSYPALSCYLELQSSIDVQNLYKKLEPKTTKCSLKYITHKILGIYIYKYIMTYIS